MTAIKTICMTSAVGMNLTREIIEQPVQYETRLFGEPGMREMTTAMKLLYGRGIAMKTAVVTDGRFSGTNNGCFVGHISPKADLSLRYSMAIPLPSTVLAKEK